MRGRSSLPGFCKTGDVLRNPCTHASGTPGTELWSPSLLRKTGAKGWGTRHPAVLLRIQAGTFLKPAPDWICTHGPAILNPGPCRKSASNAMEWGCASSPVLMGAAPPNLANASRRDALHGWWNGRVFLPDTGTVLCRVLRWGGIRTSRYGRRS